MDKNNWNFVIIGDTIQIEQWNGVDDYVPVGGIPYIPFEPDHARERRVMKFLDSRTVQAFISYREDLKLFYKKKQEILNSLQTPEDPADT